MSRVVKIDSSRVKNFFAFQKDPLHFLVGLVGKGDVISLQTGSFQSAYVVNSPDFIKAILVTHEKDVRKGRSSKVLRRTVGDGLLTSEKEQHRKQKKYMQPAFYKERLHNYAQIVVEETEGFVEKIATRQFLDVHSEMMKLTLTIITKTMFDTSVEDQKEELAQAVDDTIEQTAKALFSPIIFPLAVPTRGNLTHKRAIRTLEEMVYDTLEKAKQSKGKNGTLLDMLIDTKHEDGTPISDEEIRDQMMTMLLAGHETTANALTWVFYLLSSHPETYQRLCDEIDQIDGPLTYSTVSQLSFTKQVIDETLRLYPPAWIILRELEQPLEMLGETFPSNSSFLISPYAIHRNPDVFSAPNEFRPERFEQGNTYELFQYFPFGGGARGCIGSRFALMEAMLILATITRKLTFRHVEKEIIPEPLVSLRVKGGLKAEVVMR